MPHLFHFNRTCFGPSSSWARLLSLGLLCLPACSSSNDVVASKTGANGCPVNSGFEGDDTCLAASPEAMLLHYGPANYDDPNEVALYTLAPGDEVNNCFYSKAPNTEDFYFSKAQGRLRPGSHHLIVRAMTGVTKGDGFQSCGNDGVVGQADDIGSSTYKEWEFPPDAPEFAGYSGLIPANRTILLNGHFINSTDKPTLEEAWVEYTKVDQSQVTHLMQPMTMTGGLGFNITPGTHQTYSYSCNAPSQAVQVIQAVGHFHAHTLHFSASKRDASGVQSPLLDLFDWHNLASYAFDSVTTNAPANLTAKTDGAWTGPLTLSPTDTIDWSCEINNDSNITLKFHNEVQTGEMCIFGAIISAESGTTPSYNCVRN